MFKFHRQETRVQPFLEVKKPNEPVSRVQWEEIAYMQGPILDARVLRLIERR